MPDLLNNAKSRATTLLSGFTAGQKTMTALAVFALIVGAVMFSSWAGRPTYGPLFTNLSPSDAAAITQKLTSDKVAYRLADSGTSVMVPVNRVYQERITLAAAGLPGNAQSGYSLLDKEGITTSQFTQQVDYQRALQGELEKTISAIDGVSAASVHLVIPQQSVFADSSEQPSASVLIAMTPGQTLNPTQVQAVVHLVASSVQGLDPANVTVTDSHGDVLAAPGTDSAEMAAGNSRQQQTDAFDNDVAKSIQDMLTQVIGPNRAVVRVTADLDFDQKSSTSQTYPNAKPIPLNQTSTKETYQGNGTPPTGGTLTAGSTQLTTTSGGQSTYSNTQTGTNYAVDQVTQQVTQAPGAVNRLSVAVALDSRARGVSPATVQQLVAAAAGIQPSRGDRVDVAVVPFDTTVASQTKSDLKAAASAKAQAKLLTDVKTGLLLLGVLVAVAMVLRSAKRAPQRLPIAIGPDLTLEPGQRSLELSGSGGRPTTSGEIVPAEPAAVAAMTRQLNSAQPEAVAGLLRDWLADPR
jgi:flagellar M-ring protein FliF